MSGAARLAGQGVALVRERAVASRIQGRLERMYGLDRIADVADFVCGTEAGRREALLLRDAEDGLELSVLLPPLEADIDLDTLCQFIEGVSHFVYLVERSRVGREATQLELELQAEVDKWVVLADSMAAFDAAVSAKLRIRLYEDVSFAHERESELGERYRLANEGAHRFVRRLEDDYVRTSRYPEMRGQLRRFFHVGQEDKLRSGHSG